MMPPQTKKGGAAVDWWTTPPAAYSQGLRDGYQLGHDEAIREILDTVYGGTLLHDAHRTIAATPTPPATQATTPHQPGSWPHGHPDWPGHLHMTPDQRRAAYRHLMTSWDA